MKKILPFLSLLLVCITSKAQITTSIIRANFGIDGNLSTNYFDLAPLPGKDDWFFNGDPGSGQFVIDTTGAAAIVDGYSSNPSSTGNSFSRGMSPVIYSIINGKLLMDANFTRDFHGNDATVFASGSNKNGMSAALWNPTTQSVPDKNDILDAFTHVRRDGPNTSDSLWMFGGLSIENTTGNRYFDFELFQTNFSYNPGSQTFAGYGPDAGHTSWVFDGAGNIVTPGDIIFTAEFSSSGLTLIEARIWVNQATLSTVPTAFDWGGLFDGDGSGATFGYANIIPKSAGAFYSGILNSAPTSAGPYALLRGDNSVVADYVTGQFMEFSVNLTKLGIDPATYGNACGAPFRSVLIKTRASTSFTAELKDFVAPFELFSYTQPDAAALLTYFCGTMPSTTISVINPVPTSQYIWSTSNGNIIGSNTNTTVTIDAPGTYYVTQKLNWACAPLGLDSVAITFNPICLVLNTDITDFSVTSANNNAHIAWKAANNELALKYQVEFSNDKQAFYEVGALPATEKNGDEQYSFNKIISSNQPGYYRIKLIGKNGAVKYSQTIFFNAAAINNRPVIFPNPSHGDAILSVQSSGNGTISICLLDLGGRVIKNLKASVRQGSNQLPLKDLAKQTGMYLLKIKTADGESTQRLVIKK